MAASVLLLYASGQIGSTYGEYSTTQQQDSSIELCSVFPGQLEQLLTELSGHVLRIIELKASLAGYSYAGESGGSGSSADPAALSPDELEQAAGTIAAQLSSTDFAIAAVDGQLSSNSRIWQQILQEAASAAALLYQAKGYMLSLQPGCLELRDTQIWSQLQADAAASGVLSEPLSGIYIEIARYLSAIHTGGAAQPEGNPDRSLLVPADSGFAVQDPLLNLVARAYSVQPDVSADLLAGYEQLNAGLTSARSSLTAELASLQSRQQEIAEAQAALQEPTAPDEAADGQTSPDSAEPGGGKPDDNGVTPPADNATGGTEGSAGEAPDQADGSASADPAAEEAGGPATPESGTPADNTAAPDTAAGSTAPEASPVPEAEPFPDTTTDNSAVQDPPSQASPAPATETSKGGDN